MARFKPNPNLERDVKREPQYRAALHEAAESVAEAAQTIARSEAYDDGDYYDGIKAVTDGDETRVDATDWKSHWIEWGTVDQPAVAPLRRAAIAAGLRLDESPKT